MTQSLEHSIMRVGSLHLASYRRLTKASDEIQQDLGLNPNDDNYVNLGINSVEEFIVLQTAQLAKNDIRNFNLESVGQDVRIVSLYVDAPQADSIEFALVKDGVEIFDFNLNRNKTPYDFPDAPLTSDIKIRVKAKTSINLLRIIVKPVVILETLLAEEDTPPSQQ